eukprot:CAMPEP_0198209906 /NCGR_PEP_ID=MMETSP1445-20131203/17808_1 /TAXON_ID=36898 /ORGANISM="Pyramimonas sp., Strain CCMP2087" /LENGTH=145 /DNA_ID=CAMNT_0043883819 /DNA_START=112 /DNA_END=549 /DNA_ORIENTATION=-
MSSTSLPKFLDKLNPVSNTSLTKPGANTWDRSGSGASLEKVAREATDLKWWERLKVEKGRGGAIGVGCGAGVGLGIVGSLGLGIGSAARVVFGVGAGCGVGVGYGFGAGVGKRWDTQYISPEMARKELKKAKKELKKAKKPRSKA